VAEANLHALIESTEDLIWSVDLDYRLVAFNTAAATHLKRNYGVTPALGMTPPDCLPPDSACLWSSLYGHALSEGPFRVQHSLLDGRTLEVVLNPILQDGCRIGVSVFGKDITVRKQAEQELAQREGQLRTILRTAHDAFWMTDLQGRLLDVNDSACAMLLYGRDELLSMSLRDIIVRTEAQIVERNRQIIGRGSLFFESQVRCKDGRILDVETSANFLDQHGGRVFSFCRDVTERRRADAALRESEARLREAEHLAQVGYSIWDAAADTTFWSPELYRITGWDPSLPPPAYEERTKLYTRESWGRMERAMRRAVETGEPYELELEIVRPDGAVRSVFVRGRAVRDNAGRVARLQGTLQDITERKAVERSLTEAELKYRTLFESAIEGIFQTSPDGKFIDANPSLAKLLGYETVAELMQGISDTRTDVWVDPEDRLRIAAMADRQGTARNYECQWRRRDGMAEWVSVSARKIGPAVDMPSYEGFAVNITERKRADEALRESEARFRNYFELPLIGTAVMSPEKEWIAVNDRFCEIVGYSREELSQRNWTRLTHPDDLAACTDQFDRVLTGEIDGYALDKRYLRKDGTIVWAVIANRCVRKPDGGVSYLCGAVLDITDRKRAEIELQESNKRLRQLSRDLLRTQDQERRRIARELHDSTSQLLAALSMNLSRLRHPALEPDRKSEALSEALDLARACSEEIRTVTYLLHPPLLDEFGLAGALRSYTQGFQERTGIQVEIQMAADFGRLSREVESTLFRIFQEGLANIHKHSGSRLAVVRLERRGDEVKLTIQDWGKGFPVALRQAAGFAHFGVGIMGMRERAEQLGGRLEIDSNGDGAQVTFVLPEGATQ
jgi:PAS domain S-box-containing protein